MALRVANSNNSLKTTLALRRAMDPAMLEKRCMRYTSSSEMYSALMSRLPALKTTSAHVLTNFMITIANPIKPSEDNDSIHAWIDEPKHKLEGIHINEDLPNLMLSETPGKEKPIIFPYLIGDEGEGHFIVAVALPTGYPGGYDIDIVPSYALEGWMGNGALWRLRDIDPRIKIRSIHDVVIDLKETYGMVINLQPTTGTCSNWGFKLMNMVAELIDQLAGKPYAKRLTVYKHIYNQLSQISEQEVEFLKTDLIVGEGLPNNYKNNTYFSGEPINANKNYKPLVPGVNTILTYKQAGYKPFHEHENFPEENNAFNSNYSSENNMEGGGAGKKRRQTRRRKLRRVRKTRHKNKA